jgi:hypothetical protein
MSGAPDIIWILVDGIRPDKLRCCGNRERPETYLDRVLLQGALFTKVVAAGANSKTSMHAAFTCLPPSLNGMNAYDPELQIKLDPLALTLTDVLRLQGYRTFRWVDMVTWLELCDKHQVVPGAGFHVWESSGYSNLASTPGHSFRTGARDRFLEQVNREQGPKFAYLHLLTSHEVNVESMRTMGTFTLTSELYEGNLEAVGRDLQDVLEKLEVKDDTLVVVSTDHGARLDLPDIVAEERAHGMRLRDISMNTFCSFRHPALPPAVCTRMVRTADIAPTILDLAGCPPIPARGISLLPVLRGEAEPEPHAFMETGGIYEDPPCADRSNVWGVRTERWKYWLHESRGPWLIDLENDPAEEHNLSGQGLPVEEELHRVLRTELIDDHRPVEALYADRTRGGDARRAPSRREIPPEVSTFLLVPSAAGHLAETIRAARSQLAAYWELTVLDLTGGEEIRRQVEALEDFRVSYRRVGGVPGVLAELRQGRGRFLSLLHADSTPRPYCTYELMRAAQQAPAGAIVRGAYVERDLQKLGSRPAPLPAGVTGSGLALGFFFLLPAELAPRLRDVNWSGGQGFRAQADGEVEVHDVRASLGSVYRDPGPVILACRLGGVILRHLRSRRTWSRLPQKSRRVLSILRAYRERPARISNDW